MMTFWNCTVTDDLTNELVCGLIADLQKFDLTPAVYWMFDTGSGANLTYTTTVFPADAIRIPTASMRTASGSPLPATFGSTFRCGFKHVKHCPDAKFCIFSKLVSKMLGWITTLSPDDVFYVYDPDTGRTFDFRDYGGGGLLFL